MPCRLRRTVSDLAHGGEILDLINPRTGAPYLGRPPFASAEARGGSAQ
jgi:hypothetical protein